MAVKIPNNTAVTPVGIRAYRTANMSAASGALTNVPLQTTEYNDSSATYTLTAGGKIRVLFTGLYVLSFSMNFVGGTSGSRNVQATRNGSAAENMMREGGLTATAARPSGSGIIRVTANDEIGLTVYVDGGTAVTIECTYVKDVGLDLARIA